MVVENDTIMNSNQLPSISLNLLSLYLNVAFK